MTQEISVSSDEIIAKLVRLQSDVNFIKEKLGSEDLSFKEEMGAWEEASEEDISNWD